MGKRDLTYQSHQVQPKNESRVMPKISGQRRVDAFDVHLKHRAAHDPNHPISCREQLVSRAYTLGDNDLARDNLENDLPDADLQDL